MTPTTFLSQLLNQTLRIHASDGRIFTGQLKCTDKDRNVILALAHEYRAPSADVIRKTVRQSTAASGDESARVAWLSRYVGLVVVPGQHIVRIEVEERGLPGQRGRVAL